jgi:excisionase family DNA binding protein
MRFKKLTVDHWRNHMDTKLLRSEEVAELLQVSRSFAYQLIKRGEIPSVKDRECGAYPT